MDAGRVLCLAVVARFPRSCPVQVEGVDVLIANHMEMPQAWEAVVEAPWGGLKTCISAPLEVSLVGYHLIGSRSISLVLFCEEQLGNGM